MDILLMCGLYLNTEGKDLSFVFAFSFLLNLKVEVFRTNGTDN